MIVENGPESKDLKVKLFDFFYFLKDDSSFLEPIELIASLLSTKKDAENIFLQIEEIIEDLEDADCDKILKALMLARFILSDKEKGLIIYETLIMNKITKFEELVEKLIENHNEEKMEDKDLKKKQQENKIVEFKTLDYPTQDNLINNKISNEENQEKNEITTNIFSLNEDFEKSEINSDRSKEEYGKREVFSETKKHEKLSINSENEQENKISENNLSKNIETNQNQISGIQIDNISQDISSINEFPNTLPTTKFFDSTNKISDDILHSKGDELNILSNLENFPNSFSNGKAKKNSIQMGENLIISQKKLLEETKYNEEDVIENINVIFNPKSKNKDISFISINLLLKYLIQDKEFHNIESSLIKAIIFQKSGIIHNKNLLEIIYSIFDKYNDIHSSNNIINNGLGLILINWIYYRYEEEIYFNIEVRTDIIRILEKLEKKLPTVTFRNKSFELLQLINLLKSDEIKLNNIAHNNIVNPQRYSSVIKIKKFLDLEDTFALNQKLIKNQYINNERTLPSFVKQYFDLTQWSEVEIARQFTLITHFIFSSINPKELINSQWTKNNKHTESPHVVKMIDRFNKISFWVCEEILAYDKALHRSQIIEKFILIANELKNMNNFNDAFAIIIALNSFQIKSLQKSWNKISLERVVIFKDLDELFSYSKNYGSLRVEMEKVNNEPSVPYLGYFLKELAFLDEGPKYVTQPNLVNIEKIIKTQKILDKIIKFQAFDYRFKPMFKLCFLADPSPLNEDQLTELSGRLEPFFNLSNKKSKSKRLTNTDLKDQSINSTFKDFMTFYNRYSFDVSLKEKVKILNDWN